MINIVLSTYDFNNEYCYKRMKYYLNPFSRVVILPFTHAEEYYEKEKLFDELYHYDYGKDFNIIANSFKDYGIQKEDIYVLNPYRDSVKYMKERIEKADIVFATGGCPLKFMQMVEELDLIEDLQNFEGVFMGSSAGAVIQVNEFVLYNEDYKYSYHKGLGLLNKDLDIIVHFKFNLEHLEAMFRSYIERPNIQLITIKDGECFIFKN